MDAITGGSNERMAVSCSCGLSVDLRHDPQDSIAGNARLDEFEVRLIGMLCTDLSIREIARRVGYSQRHVERRIRSLYARIGVGARHEATYMAGRLGVPQVDA